LVTVAKKSGTSTRKEKRSVPNIILHINASFNNTIVTATDLQGNTLAWSSAAAAGFKGSKKSTPYAASCATQIVMDKLTPFSIQEVEVRLNGPGPGRDSAVRIIANYPVLITSIIDITPIPHNGCRARKRRRV
jgi:small subunit ribosomal protein S11